MGNTSIAELDQLSTNQSELMVKLTILHKSRNEATWWRN